MTIRFLVAFCISMALLGLGCGSGSGGSKTPTRKIQVTSVQPKSIYSFGGYILDIYGEGFSGRTELSLEGPLVVDSMTVVDDSHIRVTTAPMRFSPDTLEVRMAVRGDGVSSRNYSGNVILTVHRFVP